MACSRPPEAPETASISYLVPTSPDSPQISATYCLAALAFGETLVRSPGPEDENGIPGLEPECAGSATGDFGKFRPKIAQVVPSRTTGPPAGWRSEA